MKKTIIFYLVLTLSLITALAQVPKKMSFQSVIRDQKGDLISNKKVSIRFSILQNIENGEVVYSEIHKKNTNINGLVSLEIGGGEKVIGNFENINWSSGLYFVKIETDPNGGSDFVISGTSQLLSVPFAFYSENSGNQKPSIELISIKNDSLIFTFSDGKSINAGKIIEKPRNIVKSEIINDSLFFTYNDNAIANAGKIKSEKEMVYLYPEDFGAMADDVNFDNTLAFQKAIDSATKSGKIIYLNKGIYYIYKTLYIRKHLKTDHDEGIKILGSGINQTTILSKVKNAPLIVIENAYLDGTPIPGYFFIGGYIKNLIFQGTWEKSNCLNITGWYYGVLENIQIRNFDGNAVHMPIRDNFGPPNDPAGKAYTDNYSSMISIKYSKIDNNGGWGYFDERDNSSSDLYCEKTIFASNYAGGTRFGGQSIRLIGCAIAYNGFGSPTGGGLELSVNGTTSHNNYITQIEFDGNNQYHIKMNAVLNTTVTNCRFLFHDLIDHTRMTPENGGILLASDAKYPGAVNVNITNNFIRIDQPITAITKRQNLYFTRFISHASCYHIKIIDNYFQTLPSGFNNYHNFTRYDYYFDSRLGISNNIIIDDGDPVNYYPSAHGKLPPYFDGIIKNTSTNSISSLLKCDFPITYGGQNILNLDEYVKNYDQTTNLFIIPESGCYEIHLGLATASTNLSGVFFIEYYLDNSIFATHSFVIQQNIDNWINDFFNAYFYKGLRLGIKVRSSIPLNFSTTEKSKLYLKMAR